MNNDKIIVYTDGSCLNNGSPDAGCGWAAKLIYNGKYRLKSGGCRGKTNNQMEMLAVLNALQSIKDRAIPVEIYSDSQYVVKTLMGQFRIGKNIDLWNELMTEYRKFKDIKAIWVRGHNGNIHNEEVDNLAMEESKRWQ